VARIHDDALNRVKREIFYAPCPRMIRLPSQWTRINASSASGVEGRITTRPSAPSVARRSTCKTSSASRAGVRRAPARHDPVPFRSEHLPGRGEIVPVVETNLAPGEWVYFEHHCMLWKADSVPLSVMNLQGPKRSFFRMPPYRDNRERPRSNRLQSRRHGRGRRPSAAPGMEVDAREHAFLLASGACPIAMYGSRALPTSCMAAPGCGSIRFVTSQAPGLLVLHATAMYSNACSLPARAFRWSRVRCSTRTRAFRSRRRRSSSRVVLRRQFDVSRAPHGSRRVGIQSMYHHHESGE